MDVQLFKFWETAVNLYMPSIQPVMEGEGKCEWELYPVCVGGDGWLGLVIGVRERSSNIGRYEHCVFRTKTKGFGNSCSKEE